MYPLIVIGGGASGMAAAVTAAACGLRRIVILEKLPRTGRKLLATGNGRCNLSHTEITAADYAGSVPVEGILGSFGDVSTFFGNLGLFCRTDAQGRMYPYSMTAAGVLDALRLRLKADGTQELCGREVTALIPQRGYWQVQTAAGECLAARSVIFAAGGWAAPKFGTDGSSWKILEQLGIPLVSPHPILCPVGTDPALLRQLKGLRVRGSVTLFDGDVPVCTRDGEVQFTEKALSGICVFDLSGQIDSMRTKAFRLSVNCFPECDTGETLARLYTCQAVRPEASCEDMLTGLVHKALGRAVLERCAVPPGMPCSSLSGRQLAMIAERLHGLEFPVTGTAGFAQAQATAGGVPGSALGEDLQVKRYPGLFVTGEAVDVHSVCGGYHLHWCWASGACAGMAAAKLRREEPA